MAEVQEPSPSSTEIKGDLVRQVADRVYKMLLKEAQTDYERQRIRRSMRRRFGGR